MSNRRVSAVWLTMTVVALVIGYVLGNTAPKSLSTAIPYWPVETIDEPQSIADVQLWEARVPPTSACVSDREFAIFVFDSGGVLNQKQLNTVIVTARNELLIQCIDSLKEEIGSVNVYYGK